MFHFIFKKFDKIIFVNCDNESQIYINNFMKILSKFDNLFNKFNFNEN